MKLLYQYKNGNYIVKIYDDGTKVRYSNDDDFKPNFPESIDLKITNYCDQNCPMCHENSNNLGKHASFDASFLDKLHPGIEIAIGGGNPLAHPNLIEFLKKLKTLKVISNITINEKHFLKNYSLVQNLIDEKLVYGVGISLNKFNEKTLEFAKKNNNVIFHLIAGLVKIDDLIRLYDKDYKILILGYKNWGRGKDFYSENIQKNIKILDEHILEIIEHFKVVSFDNLSLKQLNIKEKLDKDVWDKIFMGDDGQFTMYIDLVKGEFAKNSTSPKRYKILDELKEMFLTIKNENN